MAAEILRWILLLLPILPHASTEKFFVVGAKAPVSALFGDFAFLPCSVSNQTDVREYEVRWYRPTMYNKPVVLYKNGQITKSSADKQYQGRVSLFGVLEKGDVSLKLVNLTLEDEGEYICHVSSETWYDKNQMSLKIQALGSIPVLSVAAVGGQVNVSCDSHGWLPKPSLTWTDREGRELKHLSKDTFAKGANELVNVSSWLLVSPSESGWLSCSVALSNFNEYRRESRVLPYSPTESWKGAFIVTLVILLLCIICIIGIGTYCVLHQKDLTFLKKKKTVDSTQSTGGTEAELLLKSVEEKVQQRQNNPQPAVSQNQSVSVAADQQESAEEQNLHKDQPAKPFAEWDNVKRFKVNITMDEKETPDFLRLGKNGRSIFCPDLRKDHEDDKRIFTLCKENFSSGQHYWELKVGQKPKEKLSWYIGAASGSAERYYKQPLSPNNEFWVLCYEEERGVHIRGTEKTVPISDVSDELKKLGVFLDCTEHTLSFYDVDSKSLIYTFAHVQHRTPLYPLISPGIRDQNPVDIC